VCGLCPRRLPSSCGRRGVVLCKGAAGGPACPAVYQAKIGPSPGTIRDTTTTWSWPWCLRGLPAPVGCGGGVGGVWCCESDIVADDFGSPCRRARPPHPQSPCLSFPSHNHVYTPHSKPHGSKLPQAQAQPFDAPGGLALPHPLVGRSAVVRSRRADAAQPRRRRRRCCLRRCCFQRSRARVRRRHLVLSYGRG